MLSRNRAAKRIDNSPVVPRKGFEHLEASSIATLRWLNANRVDYVLVGAVAEAIRRRVPVSGPVAVVPAPYRRNFERLAGALTRVQARQRIAAEALGQAEPEALKPTAEMLAGSRPWAFRCGVHDLDVEGRPSGAPRYQELLYEAGRFEVADGVAFEVAAPEDIERYAHLRRTGIVPEIQIKRSAQVQQDS